MAHELDRPFVVGDRLYLRPLEVDEVSDEYIQWVNNTELAAVIPGFAFPSLRADVERYVAKCNADAATILLAIIEKKAGKHLGNAKLAGINWTSRRADSSILIGASEAKSKGYGTEAIRLVTRYAFEVLNLHKIFAACIAGNTASIHAYEKAGFIKEAVLKEFHFTENHYEDLIYLGINRSRYDSLSIAPKVGVVG